MKIRQVLNTIFKEGGLQFIRDFLLFKFHHKKAVPRALNIATTWKCNLRCDICYHSRYLAYQESMGHDARKNLSPEKWREILLEYKKNGTGSVTCTGGETLLYPEIVDIAYDIFGTGCIIITNGTQLINPKWRTRIFVSIHAAEAELNDKICRALGAFDKVVKNIENDDRFVISLVLNHENIKQIKPMVELTRKLNVRGVLFSGYTPGVIKPGEKPDPLILTQSDVKYVVSELMQVWKNNKDVVLMTPEIINLFWSKKHQKGCSIRGGDQGSGWVLSLNSGGESIEQCVMGKGSADCNECQCIIPKQMEALKWAIPRALLSFNLDIIVRAVDVIKNTFTYEPKKAAS